MRRAFSSYSRPATRWRPLVNNSRLNALPRAATYSSTTSSNPPKSLAAGLALGIFVGTIATTTGITLWQSNSGGTVAGATTPRWRREGPDSNSSNVGKYASRDTMLKAVAEIQKALGTDAVSVDESDLEEHGHSEWSTSNTPVRPVAIVRPRSTEEVSAIARICTKFRVPMVPYGAGSSVEGNFSSPFSGVCIDLSAMDKVVAFHPEDMDVVVQAGVNWTNLNTEIKDSGLFLPLDPSPTALVGGMVATNCSGTNAMRYGTMKDYVINLTVVLADGSVIKTRHRPRKTSAGYNLNSLFTGSEGTLGIITEVTLKLAIIPTKFSVATVAFESVHEAAAAASKMIRSGIPLAALELMDDVQMKVVNKNGGAGGRMWAEKPTLFLKYGTNNCLSDMRVSAKYDIGFLGVRTP